MSKVTLLMMSVGLVPRPLETNGYILNSAEGKKQQSTMEGRHQYLESSRQVLGKDGKLNTPMKFCSLLRPH